MMKVTLTFTVETIDNGYILRDEAKGSARYVQHEFGLAREMEQIAGKTIRAQLAEQAPMQQEEA